MKRGLLLIGLLLSVGFNLGLFVAMLANPATDTAELPGADEVVRERADVAAAADLESAPPTVVDPQAAEEAEEGAAAVPETRPPDRRQATAEAAGEERAALDSERVADRLRLRGERRRRFLELQAELRRRTRELAPRVVRARRQLARELVADHPDRETIGRLIEQIAQGQAVLDRELARTVVQSRALMNPRQEAMFRRFLSRRLLEWRPAAGRRPPEGPRPPEG